jgi:type IV pilus assembly protein PilA
MSSVKYTNDQGKYHQPVAYHATGVLPEKNKMRCAKCANEAMPGQQFCAEHRPGRVIRDADENVVYANFGQRAAAALIDYLAIIIGGFVVSSFVLMILGPNLSSLAMLLFVVAYYVIFESSPLQATPGKLAVSIKVTSTNGERIGIGQALGRFFSKILSSLILYIGYLMPLFTAYRQALHDKIAGTFVVRRRFEPSQIAEAGPAPSTSGGAIIAIIAILVFGGIFILGILAAIAIPAYQDYTVRSQVVSGLNAAAPYKDAVAQVYSRGTALNQIGTSSLQPAPDSHSPYVQSIDVVEGAIRITFGDRANQLIAQRTLVLAPALDAGRSLVWVCGGHAAPDGATLASRAGTETTVTAKFLPALCRP